MLIGQAPSLLLLSFDEIDERIAEFFEAVSEEALSEAEYNKSVEEYNSWKNSDSEKKVIRVPIPIGKVTNSMHVSSTAAMGKSVDWNDGIDEPVISGGSNSVSIQIKIKSALIDLSTVADLFYGLAEVIFPQTGNYARASFFGGNICFYDGYLTGIVRQQVSDTDMEIMNLKFERKRPSKKEQPREKEPASQSSSTTPPIIEGGTE